MSNLIAHALIKNSMDELLILKRTLTEQGKENYEGGKWDIPGGTVEKLEFPSSTAVRGTKEETNLDVTVERMKQALKEAFTEEYGEYERIGLVEDADACSCAGSCGSGNVRICSLTTKEFQDTYDMYASWDWRYGKSPECEVVHSKRFSWGEVQVHLKLKNLYIEECKVYSDSLDVEFPDKLENVLINQRFDIKNVETEDDKIKEVIKWLAQE